uniref:LIM zinc-binding domain-containing protein n=1 Tax=Crocodylus porosus TaxID=8502 RepID=A0A7M4EUR1_CROPO
MQHLFYVLLCYLSQMERNRSFWNNSGGCRRKYHLCQLHRCRKKLMCRIIYGLGNNGFSEYCYTSSGMILCKNNYIRLFGNSGACSACGQSIPASELVMRGQGNVYHLKYMCSTCQNRLVPGDQFHYINGSLFCEHDRPTALINGHLNSLQSSPLLNAECVLSSQILFIID